MTITLNPENTQFEAMPDESILEAALRAGINVRYQCSNGSCGQCRARVLSGQVQSLYGADFPLSVADKQANICLMCASAANADVTLQVHGAHAASDVPTQVIDAKLSRMEELDNGVFVAHVRTPRSSTLWFLAGQQVRISWGDSSFNTAIASCPCNGMQLQFHLHVGVSESVDDFIANAKKGMTVVINGPFGECTLNEKQQAPIILISNDTGFATSKSIIEHAIALDWPHAVRLYRQFQTLPGHYMHNYCRSWAEALDDYAHMDFTDATVMQIIQQLQKEPQLIISANFYVAGGRQWFDATRTVLIGLGIEGSRIYSSVDDNT